MHPVLNLEEDEHCMPDPTLALLPSGPLEVLATWPQGSLWCLWPADVPSPRIESGQNFVLPNWNTSQKKKNQACYQNVNILFTSSSM